MNRKLRMAMIGGGQGAFIGAVHRIVAAMDGQIELVAGAFSADPEKSRATGALLFLDSTRVYDDYKEMIEREAQRPPEERIDIVSIVTPNHVHYEPARMALENGFHVVLEKPITFSLQEAKELDRLVIEKGLYLLLCHTYTGYPMLKQAKTLIKEGVIGKVRKVYVEYPQGWLSTFLEGTENKQAGWRTDPSKSGKAGAMGDIGTHAFNLAEYVTGLEVTQLCADVHTVVEGRMLDDDGAALLRFNNGASGVLMATQVAAGEENNVRLRVYGEKGGLEWKHEDANTLLLKWPDKPAEKWRTGSGYVSNIAAHNTRVPAGHPEGYLEAFANLYRNFALCVGATIDKRNPEPEWLDFPNAKDGIRGMAFIDLVVESGKSAQKWLDFKI